MLKYTIYTLLVTILLAACAEMVVPFILNNPGLFASLSESIKTYYMSNERKIVQYLPQCAQYDTELSYILKPGICQFNNREYSTTISVNSKGLRDNEEALSSPELIVTGDSFAFGWGVESAQTFAAQLKERKGLRVLNAAIPSYGTARELIALKRLDLSSLKYLVIQHCENDQDENIYFNDHDGKLDIMSQEKYKALVDTHLLSLDYWPGKYITEYFKALKTSLSSSPVNLTEQAGIDRASAFLKVLKNAPVNLSNIKIIVLSLNPRAMNDHWFSVYIDRNKAELVPGIADNLKVIDTSALLTLEDYYWYDDHITALGHSKVAEAIISVL